VKGVIVSPGDIRYSPIPHTPLCHTVTRTQQLAYLRAESRDLVERLRRLYSEFEALRRAHFPPREWAAHRKRMQEYWGLVANHHIAFAWTFHPPCGQMNSSQVRDRKARAPKVVARRAKRQTKRAA
jgi:hypothetical protein